LVPHAGKTAEITIGSDTDRIAVDDPSWRRSCPRRTGRSSGFHSAGQPLHYGRCRRTGNLGSVAHQAEPIRRISTGATHIIRILLTGHSHGRRLRPFLAGEPIVLVENGKLIERSMRRERLTLDDLAEKARLSEIASIDDIRWAVLETNGDISFIKQPDG